MRSFAAISATIVFTLSASWAVAETNSDVAELKAARANTWIKIHEAETGGREQPIFVYADVIKKFVMATGMQTYGGDVPRHYDTEEFDLAARRWINAYPAGIGEGRPVSGPVGEEYSRQRAKQGYNGRQLFYEDGGHLRVGAGGQWTKTKTYGEYCYVPDSGKIYAYIWDKTLCYDVKQRTWTDLKTEPRTACRIWGSMCYDPVNKEILHAGGDGGSTEVSTRVYSIAKNEWRKLTFGPEQFNALFVRAKQLRWQTKDLLGRVASRHAVAENDEESKVDLSALASNLARAAQQFPAECPAPRAGHILAWLPKSKQIVLAGGYSRVPLAQEVWTYDVGDNKWKLLLHVPLEGNRNNRYSRNCPRVTDREFQFGAVNEGDVLVCPNGTTVWACKIDVANPQPTDTEGHVATSGSYVFNRIDPATWENAAQPEPKKTQAFLDSLPTNEWTTFDFPMYAPGARNRWGTTAYDTDRHQFLFWGGGHATSHENDVAHFSLRGSRWTIGYHPDDPIEKVYATQPTPVSFQDRVHVPIHAYKAYCYDPKLKLALLNNSRAQKVWCMRFDRKTAKLEEVQ